MKKFYLPIVLAFSVIILFNSCKDDPVQANHPLTGVWTLEAVAWVNMPVGYSYWEGIVDPPTEIFPDLLVAPEDPFFFDNALGYQLDLSNKLEVRRTISKLGADIIDDGTWNLDDGSKLLTLDLGGTFPVELTLSHNVLAEDTEFSTTLPPITGVYLYTDAALDTLLEKYPDFNNQEHVDAWNAAFDQMVEQEIFAEFDWTFTFTRQN